MITSDTTASRTRSKAAPHNDNDSREAAITKRKHHDEAEDGESKPSKSRRVSESPANDSSKTSDPEDQLLRAVKSLLGAIDRSSPNDTLVWLGELNENLENDKTTVLDDDYTREQVLEAVFNLDGISTLLQVLEKHCDSPEICHGVLRALQNATHENDENKQAILDSSGLTKILRVMDQYKDDPVLQRHACGIIQNLAHENHENKLYISRTCQYKGTSVFTFIITAMKEHLSDADLHWQAIGAILNLIPGMINAIPVRKHLDLFLSSMDLHCDHPSLLERLFALLGRLSSGTDFDRNALIEKGTIKRVMNALKRHPNVLALQEYGSLLLEILFGLDKVKKSKCNDALLIFAHISKVDRLSDCDIFEDAIRIARGIPAILQCMQRHKKSLDMQQKAVALLARITAHKKQHNRHVIIEANGVSILIQAMKRFSKDAELLNGIMQVLKDLLHHPFGYGLIRLADGIEAIAEIAKHIPECDKTAFELLLELVNMTKTKRLSLNIFLDACTFKAAIESLKLRMDDEEHTKTILLFLKPLMPLLKLAYPNDMAEFVHLLGKLQVKYNCDSVIADEMDCIIIGK